MWRREKKKRKKSIRKINELTSLTLIGFPKQLWQAIYVKKVDQGESN